ncbi:MAG: hypothetical protein KDI02_21750 [Anaerolineae bacterium]|nr:hypothetical protein [Anaerolineae bacterium]
MPIVFVHGAGTREYFRRYNVDWSHVERHLRDYVAPHIAAEPKKVEIILAYWGDTGVQLAWDGASIPWATMPPVANHPLTSLVRVGRKRHIVAESLHRVSAVLGYFFSRILTLFRRPQSKQTSVFMGDALHYLAQRGTADHPGPIPTRVLAALMQAREAQQARDGEPLIVFTHSLGGVVMYDLVTHFLPNLPEYTDIHIDFWASMSTQIGLFEEMKLFLASDDRYGPGKPVPFPDRRFLSTWWNVWDPHDFLSFSVKNIIEGVKDDHFDSGLSLAGAHLACLKMSSFYVLLGEQVAKALPAARRGR